MPGPSPSTDPRSTFDVGNSGAGVVVGATRTGTVLTEAAVRPRDDAARQVERGRSRVGLIRIRHPGMDQTAITPSEIIGTRNLRVNDGRLQLRIERTVVARFSPAVAVRIGLVRIAC